MKGCFVNGEGFGELGRWTKKIVVVVVVVGVKV